MVVSFCRVCVVVNAVVCVNVKNLLFMFNVGFVLNRCLFAYVLVCVLLCLVC